MDRSLANTQKSTFANFIYEKIRNNMNYQTGSQFYTIRSLL